MVESNKSWDDADSADGVRVGESPVPGIKLRHICRGREGTTGRIAWSPCGSFIASPSEDKTIRIWYDDTGDTVATLAGPEGKIFSVAWSPSGEVLASGGSEDGSVQLWHIERAELLAALTGHDGKVYSVA